jgi:hypothetical protein
MTSYRVVNTQTFPLLIVGCILLSSVSLRANAQYWGIKTFEECLLEKMKGQPPNMISIARVACLKQFPQERLLSEEEAQSTWCETTNESISACVKQKSGIKITKAMATFSRAPCESADPNNPYMGNQTAIAKLPFFGSTYKFEIENASQYKCARFTFYGLING